MAAYTKETLMAKINSKYPDIIDVNLVKTKEITTITYKCGHTDTVRLDSLLNRGNKSVCRICIPLKRYNSKSNQEFIDEVYKINPDLELLEEYKNNSTYLKVRSKICDHEWKILPNGFLGKEHTGSICRVCIPVSYIRENKTNEQFLKEISTIAPDLMLLEKYKGCKEFILVQSKICNHTWKIQPSNFISHKIGIKCPICNTRAKPLEQFKQELYSINPELELQEEYTNARTYITVKSKVCNHTWKILPSNFISYYTGSKCPLCNPINTSKGEKDIAELLSKYTIVETSNRSILEGLEVDIYLPEFKIGIEYNGEYWHSDKHKSKSYHLDKTNAAKQQGIKLIHIFEHEWLQKQDIVKSRLLGMLQQNYKLGARKCIVKELAFNEVKDFLNENHLQGSGSPSKYNFGLYYKGILEAVMTFSKPRFNSNYDYELIRYCSLTDINIQGGASKLLKYFTSKYKGSIISYSDKRWSDGNLYKTLGFKYSHSSEPSYFYAKNSTILSRYQCQKHKLKELVPEVYKDELTESDIMANAGYYRVYDCGTDVWIYTP